MLRVGFALWFGWVMLMAPLRAQAQTGSEAAAQLAVRISSLLPRGATVSLEFQNLKLLSPGELSSFRGALPDELRKAGIEITGTGQAEPRVRIFVSENAHGRLLVAEISTGENRQAAMLSWGAASSSGARPRITITKKLIWQQAEPILDVLLFDNENGLLVLSAGHVAGYRGADGKWSAAGLASFTVSRPAPRDPRGLLGTVGAGFRVYLPGTSCAGEVTPALKLVCTAGNEYWQADGRDRWISDRNMIETNGVRDPFYSEGGGLFATAGGKIADRSGQLFPGAESWGSDITAIQAPCAANTDAVVSTAAGDDPARDQIQIDEITNGRATPVSDPMALAGQVTALWPAETRQQVTMVVRNSKTGEYEAYRLGLACAE